MRDLPQNFFGSCESPRARERSRTSVCGPQSVCIWNGMIVRVRVALGPLALVSAVHTCSLLLLH